jgi:hypothetical protein
MIRLVAAMCCIGAYILEPESKRVPAASEKSSQHTQEITVSNSRGQLKSDDQYPRHPRGA